MYFDDIMLMQKILTIFIVVPLLEMFILIKVGNTIGAFSTVFLVVLTATIGIMLLKYEGLATLTRLRQKLSLRERPDTELVEGIMLLVGGALLLTPGFVTDLIGFSCLIPRSRRPIAVWLARKVTAHNEKASHQGNKPKIIEGEYFKDD